jgi:hypothetical protein
MNDVRFFLKAIEFLFAFLFLWFITTAITRLIWLFPLAFVVLCAYQVGQSIRRIRKRQRYEEKRAIAEEARANADRYAEEARIAADRYTIAEARVINKLTPEAVALFTNPN